MSQKRTNVRTWMLAVTISSGLALASATPARAQQAAPAKPAAQASAGKPNILVIFGDDIGYWNISAYNRGMMGYRTPNIDRIAKEGRDLHRRLRASRAARRARGLHHRPVADPYRPAQGRPPGRSRRSLRQGPDDCRTCSRRRATRPASSARITSATATSSSRRSTASTSSSATSTT